MIHTPSDMSRNMKARCCAASRNQSPGLRSWQVAPQGKGLEEQEHGSGQNSCPAWTSLTPAPAGETVSQGKGLGPRPLPHCRVPQPTFAPFLPFLPWPHRVCPYPSALCLGFWQSQYPFLLAPASPVFRELC